MNTAKNIFLFFFSFILMGLFVLLIDQMYPTGGNSIDFQTYSKKEALLEVNK